MELAVKVISSVQEAARSGAFYRYGEPDSSDDNLLRARRNKVMLSVFVDTLEDIILMNDEIFSSEGLAHVNSMLTKARVELAEAEAFIAAATF